MRASEPPIAFIHVPKTAGTTFVTALGRNFPNARLHIPNAFTREAETHRRLAGDRIRRAEFLYGHVPLSMRPEFPAGTCFITMLREPIARAYSHYRHMYNTLIDDGKAPPIESPQIPDNLQTRMLSGLPDPFTRPADDEMLAAALHELREMVFYGSVERFAESMLLAKQRLGLRWVAYRRENLRPRTEMPERYERALRAQNELDLELYERATAELVAELAPFRSRAISLERAGDALTTVRPPADPTAWGYVLAYGAARVDTTIRRRLQRRDRWRQWRSVRSVRQATRRR